jgi:hypothetical protein
MLRIPHCLDSRLTDGGRVVNLKRRSRSTLQKYFLVLISVWVNPRARGRLEGLGKSSGLERETSAWSILRQPLHHLCHTHWHIYRQMDGLMSDGLDRFQKEVVVVYPRLYHCIWPRKIMKNLSISRLPSKIQTDTSRKWVYSAMGLPCHLVVKLWSNGNDSEVHLYETRCTDYVIALWI